MATKAKMSKKSVETERIGRFAPDLLAARAMADALDLKQRSCEEASVLSKEKYIPCGASGEAAVWHEKDRRLYVMCAPCADHNVRNRGGVLVVGRRGAAKELSAQVKRGPALAIRAEDVLGIKHLRQQRDALEKQAKELGAKLKPLEDAVVAALDSGVPLGPGCPPCAVKVDERRVPRWKEIACGLAKRFLNMTAEVYEVTVLSGTEAKQYRRLIINGEK